MILKLYLKMKDSGIEWIGEIPEHWKVKRLKYLAKIETGDKDAIDSDNEGKYPFFVRSQIIERISTYSYDGEAVLTAGDGVGRVFHYVNGKFDFHQRVYKISDFGEIIGKYFFYYMKENFHKEVMKLSAKSTVDSLRRPMFLDFPVVFGDKNEQQQIADFLDKQTSKIDSEITKNQKLVELLKEKREAIINQVVTKGLDPTVSMKDSGMEWIGKIPEHWKIYKLKEIADIRGRVGWKGYTTIDLVEEGALVVGATNIQNSILDLSEPVYLSWKKYYESPEIMLKKNDLLIVQRGSTVGKTTMVYQDLGPATINPSMILITNVDADNLFISYQLQSEVIQFVVRQITTVTAIPMISQDQTANLRIVVPPDIEQQQIADFLNKQTSKIDSLISKIESLIEKLREYDKILIFDSVTGKIDVKDTKTSIQ